MTGSGKIAKNFFKRAVRKMQRTKNVYSYIERRNRLQTRKLGKKWQENHTERMAKFKLRIRK